MMREAEREVFARRCRDEFLRGNPIPQKDWIALGDRCASETCEAGKGCDACHYYRCIGCGEVRYWSDGGTDDEHCDECMVHVYAEREGQELIERGQRIAHEVRIKEEALQARLFHFVCICALIAVLTTAGVFCEYTTP
mgnify:CR=1 FL=1